MKKSTKILTGAYIALQQSPPQLLDFLCALNLYEETFVLLMLLGAASAGYMFFALATEPQENETEVEWKARRREEKYSMERFEDNMSERRGEKRHNAERANFTPMEVLVNQTISRDLQLT